MNKLVFILAILGLIFNSCAQRSRARHYRGELKTIIRGMQDGNFESASTKIEKILSDPDVLHTDSLKLMYYLSQCYVALGKWNKAEICYRWLSENDLHDPGKWRTLAKIVSQEDSISSLEHLPEAVNSKYGEIMPVISPDGKTLYFIVDQNGNQDIFVSRMDEIGNWSQRKQLPSPLNTQFSDGILSVTPDGNTVLLNGIYNSDGSKSGGYSISHNLGDDNWSFPQPVRIDNFYNRNRFTSACLSSSGKILLLSLERDNSYGDLDLYVCFRRDDGTFTMPKNLGPIVNTKGTDGTPFLASDEATLYFSSDGHPSFGSADMFVTRRLDDTWTNWSPPENLGKQLNTIEWDAYYTLTASGDYVYFVSSRKGSVGGTDIFRAKLPERVKPKPVVIVEGIVSDPDGIPIGADVKYERISDGIEVGIASSNPKTGYYSITLPLGTHYGIAVKAEGYLFFSDNLDLTNLSAASTVRKDIVLQPIRTGAKIILNNIFFEFNSAELLSESKSELERVFKVLDENPSLKVEIAGHTDSIGAEEYNFSLSQRRAQSVVDWLVSKGINRQRIIAKGYGETSPIADNGTDEGRKQNRRVTFEIIEAGER